jgi:protein transport protein SEC24
MPGYPAQQDFQAGYGAPTAPAYGAPAGQPYGAPAGSPGVPPAVGGYQAPDPYYQGAAGAAQGVSGITAGMAGMNMGGQQPQQQPPAQQARVALNQLYPTDLLNQPFNVSELDLPPPPCILPPNVSLETPPVSPCSVRLSNRLFALLVQRHAVARLELPAQVHALDPECAPHHAFAA